jgi:hypothetical protein
VRLDSRLSGYFEHQYSLRRISDEWRHIDYDRLRADLNIRTKQGSRASAGVVYQLYRGDTKIDPADFLPGGIVISQDSLGIELKDRHYLNHAYIVLGSGTVEITAGKQFLTWGAGWVFNPTELFRPKNALEPSYDREGIGAISARIALGPLSDLLLGYVPDGNLEQSGRVLRIRHHISGFDVSGLVASTSEVSIGFGREDPVQRTVIGGDITGEILGLGIWTEAARFDQDGERWTEATLGGNYTLSDGTLILIEGFYNGRGKSSSPYSTQAWLELIFGSRRTLGKTTLFGAVNRTIAQLWTVGMSVISNPGDGSLILIPAIAYSFADNIDLLFNGLLYVGQPGDEFGADQTGGFIRGRLYF